MLNTKIKQSGFTIVELLIVIVVIAILAAISIVAYNGIQNRGKASSAQSAANSLDKKIEVYNAVNSQYPITTSTITGAGVQGTVTTATTSDWYSAPNSAFTTAALPANTGGLWASTAAPTDPKVVYYTNYTTSGGCAWWYDYQNTTWKGISTGTVACPTLPSTAATGLQSIAL